MLLSLVVFAPSWTYVRDNRQRTTVQLGRLPPTRIRSCLDSIQLFLITTSTFVPRMQHKRYAHKSTQLYIQLKITHDILYSNGAPAASAREIKEDRRR